MDAFIGLDVGTSKLSAVALDVTGAVLETTYATNDAGVSGLPPGRDEQAPGRIYELAVGVLGDLAAKLGGRAQVVRALGLTGQMHGVVVVDEALEPLTHLITWQDRRGEELTTTGGRTYLEEFVEAAGDVLRVTGARPATGYMAVTLRHMARTAGLPARTRWTLLIHDWLAAKLAGAEPRTDPTDAASTGLYSVRAKTWDERLCRAAGIDVHLVPPVVEAGTPLGRVTARLAGIPPAVSVHTPLGDNQASVLAALSDPTSEVLVNVGTGGQVSAVTGRFLTGPDLDVRPFPGGRLMSVGASLCGGSAFTELGEHYLALLRRFVGEDVELGQVFDALVEMAGRIPPGADGLTVEPYFRGTRSDPSRRGRIAGVSASNNTPGHMARAYIGGLIAELAGYYRQMLDAGLEPRSRLVGSGNAIRRNPVMRESAERAFGMPLAVPAWREEAACGAALAGMVGSGALDSFDEASALVRHVSAVEETNGR